MLLLRESLSLKNKFQIMRECVTINIGQAGIQMGDSCWELFCAEHAINPDGTKSDGRYSPGSVETFFSESSSIRYTPRSVFVDLDTSVVDQLFTGPRRALYNRQNAIVSNEDASNNFARGYTLSKKMVMERTFDSIQKTVEQCDSFQGFLLLSSAGGGTGSGFSSVMMDELSEWCGRKPILEFNQFISPCLSTAIVEPYNALFRTSVSMSQSHCVFMFDNEACYDICKDKLDITNVQYQHINQLVSQTISSITESIRFDGTLNVDLTDFQVNLVPFPRVHFMMSSYSPFLTNEKGMFESMSVAEITDDCFQPKSQMIKSFSLDNVKHIACCLLYRGDIQPKDINSAINNIRDKVKFVSWSPTGFKVGINGQPPTIVENSLVGPSKRALCTLTNNTGIEDTWANMCHKFDLMFAKRAFVHWYVAEGFEEGEFFEARENLETLMMDYREMSLDSICKDSEDFI